MIYTAMIGVGGCGMNVLEYMAERLPEGSRTIGINRDAERLGRPSNIRHHVLLDELSAIDEQGDLLPAGKTAVQTVMQSHLQELKPMLHDTDSVCILAGLGGATGSWASQVIVDALRRMEKRVVIIVVEPFGFERRRVQVASRAREASKTAEYLLTCSNQDLMGWSKPNTSMDDAFARMNKLIYEAWSLMEQGKVEAGQYRIAASGDNMPEKHGSLAAEGFELLRIPA